MGTTEAAALLRYFGVRARIVDFGTQQRQEQQQQQQQQQPAMPASGTSGGSNGSLQEVHPNVECDGCGRVPIVGARYCSQVLPDYDLCERCYEGQQQGPAAPFARMMASRGAYDIVVKEGRLNLLGMGAVGISLIGWNYCIQQLLCQLGVGMTCPHLASLAW